MIPDTDYIFPWENGFLFRYDLQLLSGPLSSSASLEAAVMEAVGIDCMSLSLSNWFPWKDV